MTTRRGFDRRRSNDGSRQAYARLQRPPEERIVRERVQVPKDLKGRVIGSGGCVIKEIMRMSGAVISSGEKEDEWFEVRGDTVQREHAKKLILEKVRHLEERMVTERVQVSKDLKGRVIGSGGCVIKEIMRMSGAVISSTRKEDEWFEVHGDTVQRERAKKLILGKVNEVQQSMLEGGASQAELVEVPDQYKGLVIGKWGDNLRNISTQTGAQVISRDNELYIVSGTKEQRQMAKIHIKTTVITARLKGVENEFKKSYRYVDGWNLPAGCRLKLEPLTRQDRMFLPGPHAQYRLRPAEEYGQQDSSRPRDEPSYLVKLKKAALESLGQLKGEMETKDYLMLDMWCHFGPGIIRGPDEGLNVHFCCFDALYH